MNLGNLSTPEQFIIKSAANILLVNKTDLAPHVDVDLVSMERDLKVASEDRPYFLIQAKNNLNIEKVSQAITDLAGL